MQVEDTGTDTDGTISQKKALRTQKPGLLVAFAPKGTAPIDRFSIDGSIVVGRQPGAGFQVSEHTVSRRHFKVSIEESGALLEDLGSSNGTMVDGRLAEKRERLRDGALIRAGQCLFVFHENVVPMLDPPLERYGTVGPFHVGSILSALRQAAHSCRPCLLFGPSGVGKELAAKALAQLAIHDVKSPILIHNCALFGTEDQAVSSLFGVASRTFTGVGPSEGLVERAAGGVLFLDEVHALTERLQRGILRLLQDGTYVRIGDPSPRKHRIKLILATNMPPPEYGLLSDLVARLHVVNIPSLAERKADIPALLDHQLDIAFERLGLDCESRPRLTASLCEALCLDGLEKYNVRSLIDIADRVAGAAAEREDAGTALIDAVDHALQQGFQEVAQMSAPGKRSEVGTTSKQYLRYEEHHKTIEFVLREAGGNLAEAGRVLKDRYQLITSKKTLAKYAELWGLRY